MIQDSPDKIVRATIDSLVHDIIPIISGVLGFAAILLFKVSLLDISNNRALLAFGLGAVVVFAVLSVLWLLSKGPKMDISDFQPPPADLEIVSAWQFSRLYLVHILKILPFFVIALAIGGALVAGGLFAAGLILLLDTAMLARNAHKMNVVVLTTPVRKPLDKPKPYAMSTSRMSSQSSGNSV